MRDQWIFRRHAAASAAPFNGRREAGSKYAFVVDRQLTLFLEGSGTGLAAIVLAAGGSTRLGRPKQLMRWQDESLVRRSCRVAHAAGFEEVYVVIGDHREEIERELSPLRVHLVFNADWAKGMSSSLRAGLEALRANDPKIASVLISVCDQIGVTIELLTHLRNLASGQPAKIVASEYAGRTGVPAIFPAAWLDALASVEGDKGARSLLRDHRDHIIPVPFPEGVDDIDTEEDARRFGLL